MIAGKTGMEPEGPCMKNFRLVYRPAAPLLKCAVLVSILLSGVAMGVIALRCNSVQANTQSLRNQAIALEGENERLTQDIQQLGTPQSIRQLAAELLGLVDPDSVFFNPVEPTDPS